MAVTVSLAGEAVEVRRIFCIGRNYAAHAAELGNAPPTEPVVFMKPATAIVPPGETLRLPQGRGSVHHEAELVLLIGRDGADGEQDIAGLAVGLDLTLREEQARLKEKGLPWELAKAFDGSAPLGHFVPAPPRFDALEFECTVNGDVRQRGHTGNLLFPVAELIRFLAARFSLQRGDLVFTGTPEGVGPLHPGDVIEIDAAITGSVRWECERGTP